MVFALVAICIEIWRGDELPVAKGIALGFPIPLAVIYFLMFGSVARSFPDWLSLTLFFAPQAYILLLLGLRLSIGIFRQGDLRPIAFVAIFPVALLGHLLTMMAVGTLSGYSGGG